MTTTRLSTASLFDECRARGVDLFVDGRRLRFDAPKGAVDPALKAELTERRAEVARYIAGIVPPNPIAPSDDERTDHVCL